MAILKKDQIRRLKANWMRVQDRICEERLTQSKIDGLLKNSSNLPNISESPKFRIFWPSHYERPLTHKWLYPLLAEFKRNFVVEFKSMPKYYKAIYFEVEIDGRIYPFAIDAIDKAYINEQCASKVMVYFKMQYAKEGYSMKNVVPGGFIPAYSKMYLYLDKIREIRDRQDYEYDAYGRFGKHFAKTIRAKAAEKLSSQDKFYYEGGIGRVSYKKSLFEVARSKVCIDLPGAGPFCFRLIDYMAVGSCIIAYPHQAKLPIPLTPGKEIVYCQEDLSDLQDICEYCINNHQEREAMAQASRKYFDSYLSRPKLASYYINTILESVAAKI